MTAVETPSSLPSPTTVTPPKSLRRLHDRLRAAVGRAIHNYGMNVLPSHLADPHLFDFGNLRVVDAEKVEDTPPTPC
ncbi:MAG: hypothetical protein HC925_03270 [Coleofasciculaceae cyanobacterium SM2_3_26]|nr:hypothetical protein [Coleofasciculaceae cyanobacterium SM2_3_26]